MRDFEQDRRICEAATKGPWDAYYGCCNGGPHYNIIAAGRELRREDATFIAAAREGWPAALDEIQNLKLQLLSAGVSAASQPHCPDGKDCDGYSTSEQSCTACWLEYWRLKSGTFQNGNNQSGKAGEGAE